MMFAFVFVFVFVQMIDHNRQAIWEDSGYNLGSNWLNLSGNGKTGFKLSFNCNCVSHIDKLLLVLMNHFSVRFRLCLINIQSPYQSIVGKNVF